MAATSLVEGWEEDMNLGSDSDYECKPDVLGNYSGNVEYYDPLIEEQPRCLNNNLAKNAKRRTSSINFSYIHDQDMNYYQENYTYYSSNAEQSNNGIDERPMLELENEPEEEGPEYDPDYDQEVNKLLEDINEDFLLNEDSASPELNNVSEDKKKKSDAYNEQYEDYYDDFIEDEEDEADPPEWFGTQIDKKIREMKYRMNDLSKYVCNLNPSIRSQIMRIEQDHNSPFCKIDPARYPHLTRPWVNYWKFNCKTKCSIKMPDLQHVCTSYCETSLLEHEGTDVNVHSKNLLSSEFPEHVMHTVQTFQNFVIQSLQDDSYLYTKGPDSTQEKPSWMYIKLRSNYKKEIMLVAGGKNVTSQLTPLRRYFESGPGRASYVVSVYCINLRCFNSKTGKKANVKPVHIYGLMTLRDKVGPITITYSATTNINFNAIGSVELAKIIRNYLELTLETTLVEIGCDLGAISLMLSNKCDKVLGFNLLQNEVEVAEAIKKENSINNTSFIVSTQKEFQTKCSALIKRCISVAVVNLASHYGKTIDVVRALRNMPTIWRVVMYGSFAKEFYKHVLELTKKEDEMGDEFLPVKGCLLDKSSSSEKAFDIIILFERTSLIEPMTELKNPMFNYKKEEPISGPIKIEKGFGDFPQRPKRPAILNITCPQKKEHPVKPVIVPTVKKGMIPLLPSLDVPSEGLRLSRQERKFDCPSPPRDYSSPSAIVSPVQNFYDSSLPPVSTGARPNRGERKFDCPSPPRNNIIYSGIRLYKQERKFDCPSPPRENVVSPGVRLSKQERKFDCPSPPGLHSSPSLSNESWDNTLVLPGKGFDNPILPIKQEKGFNNSIKLEKGFDNSITIASNKKNKKQSSSNYFKPYIPARNEPLPPPIKIEPGFVPVPVNVTSGVRLSKKERKFDCPSPPSISSSYNDVKPKVEPISSGVRLSRQERKFDCPPVHGDEDFMTRNVHVARAVRPPPVTIKREKGATPPRIKIEPIQPACSPLSDDYAPAAPRVKPEPLSDKEEGELSPERDELSPGTREVRTQIVKPEPVDADDNARSKAPIANGGSTMTFDNVRIKAEPVDDYPTTFVGSQPTGSPSMSEPSIGSSHVSVKREPGELATSEMDDIENMPTPIHNPVALQNNYRSPAPALKNYMLGDSQYNMKVNKSFLQYTIDYNTEDKLEERAAPKPPPHQPTIRVKPELGIVKDERNLRRSTPSDDEVVMLDVKPPPIKREVGDLREKLNMGDPEQMDLRRLIEQRQVLQRQLDHDISMNAKSFDRSPRDTPDRYPGSRSPAQQQGRFRRASWEKPYKPRKEYYYRKRGSPTLPNGRKWENRASSRSPSARRLSPGPPYSRFSPARRRSPDAGSPSYRRFSPPGRRRSPLYRRSPPSSRSITPDRPSTSPRGYKRARSPIYRVNSKCRRPSPNYNGRGRSPPPRYRRREFRSRSTSLSLSPSSRPATPPIRRMAHPACDHFSNHCGGKGSASPPERIGKERRGTAEWDIPGLSAVEDSSPDKQRRAKKEKKSPKRRSRSSSKHKSGKKKRRSKDEKKKSKSRDEKRRSGSKEEESKESSAKEGVVEEPAELVPPIVQELKDEPQ